MAKRLVIFALALLAVLPMTHAQAEQYLDVKHQDLLSLPGNTENLFIIDGKYCFYTDGIILSVKQKQGQMQYAEADTALMRIDPEMNYAVRHPVTGNLFYTKIAKNGTCQLFEQAVDDMGRTSVRKIQPGGVKLSICHPTFSADGRFMVFHNSSRIGFGGNDLWFCEFRKNKWTAPQNMGHRINTAGNDINPCISGDFLFFSSNGRKEAADDFDLFATKLLATHVSGDTVGMIPIGRSIIQMLPMPFSSPYSDYEIAISPDGDNGFWVRKTQRNTEDFYSFSGDLRGVRLSGKISNNFENALPRAHVLLFSGDTLTAQTYANDNGCYEIFMLPGNTYTLVVEKDGYFDKKDTIRPLRPDEERLIAQMEHNVRLARLELGVPFYYDNVFPQGAVTELSEKGKEELQQIISFLQQNPQISVSMTLSSDITSDVSFNSIVTGRRIQNLQEYLAEQGVQNKVNFQNLCAKMEGCNAGSGTSMLTIQLLK